MGHQNNKSFLFEKYVPRIFPSSGSDSKHRGRWGDVPFCLATPNIDKGGGRGQMSNSAEHAVHFLRLAGQCIDGTTTKEYSVHCSVKKRDTLVQDTHMVQFLFHCFVHLNAKSLAFWAELTYQWKILDEPIVEKMLFCLKRVCVDFDKTFRAICKDTKVTRDCLQKTMVQQSLQPGGGRAGSPEVLEADAVLLVAQAGIVAQQQDMKDANGIVAAFKAFGDNPGPGDEDLLFYFIVFQMDMEERWKACEAKGIMRTEGGKANEDGSTVQKEGGKRVAGSNKPPSPLKKPNFGPCMDSLLTAFGVTDVDGVISAMSKLCDRLGKKLKCFSPIADSSDPSTLEHCLPYLTHLQLLADRIEMIELIPLDSRPVCSHNASDVGEVFNYLQRLFSKVNEVAYSARLSYVSGELVWKPLLPSEEPSRLVTTEQGVFEVITNAAFALPQQIQTLLDSAEPSVLIIGETDQKKWTQCKNWMEKLDCLCILSCSAVLAPVSGSQNTNMCYKFFLVQQNLASITEEINGLSFELIPSSQTYSLYECARKYLKYSGPAQSESGIDSLLKHVKAEVTRAKRAVSGATGTGTDQKGWLYNDVKNNYVKAFVEASVDKVVKACTKASVHQDNYDFEAMAKQLRDCRSEARSKAQSMDTLPEMVDFLSKLDD